MVALLSIFNNLPLKNSQQTSQELIFLKVYSAMEKGFEKKFGRYKGIHFENFNLKTCLPPS